MKSILEKLTMTPSPSGSETPLSTMIQSLLPDIESYVDTHGTVVMHKKGTGDGTVVLCAIDTPCMYVTYPEKGFSRFSAVGGLKPSVGMQVVCQNHMRGIIGKDEDGFFIDTASNTLSIGDWAVCAPSFQTMDEDRVCGTALGQYGSITACILAAMQNTAQKVWFVFATKSHIQQTSPTFMKNIFADRLISVEVSVANDTPAEKTVFASLGNGTTLRVKDANMISSPDLIQAVSSVPYKIYKEVSETRGIGGVVQKAYGGIKSVGIGIPTRNLGTAGEVISLSDIKNTADILAYLLQ